MRNNIKRGKTTKNVKTYVSHRNSNTGRYIDVSENNTTEIFRGQTRIYLQEVEDMMGFLSNRKFAPDQVTSKDNK